MTINVIKDIKALLQTARARLSGISDTPGLDAELLLAHSLTKQRSHLYTWPEQCLEPDQLQRFIGLLARRLNGEPVAHIIGRREFWSLELTVTPATLIPRPETELLVELALERIPHDRSIRVADLGTGSGAIALAVARERPRARIIATDISPDALAVAKLNARQHNLDNVKFRQGDWCSVLQQDRVELILSNPPYIAVNDPHLNHGGLAYEPRSALIGGADGLDAIRTIIAQAGNHLYPDGWLLLEHGYDQGQPISALLKSQGFKHIRDYQDAIGLSRVTCGRWLND